VIIVRLSKRSYLKTTSNMEINGVSTIAENVPNSKERNH